VKNARILKTIQLVFGEIIQKNCEGLRHSVKWSDRCNIGTSRLLCARQNSLKPLQSIWWIF